VTDGDWPELMTVAEVAQILRVSKITIYRLIDTGELKSTRIGRSFRVYADSFRQLTQVLAHG
jgi:excisionase family DNA binding protein